MEGSALPHNESKKKNSPIALILKQSDILLANPSVGSAALDSTPIFELLLAEGIEKAINFD